MYNYNISLIDTCTTEIIFLKTRQCSQKMSAIQFQSDCAFGRCVCRGKTYQFLTCLRKCEIIAIIINLYAISQHSKTALK